METVTYFQGLVSYICGQVQEISVCPMFRVHESLWNRVVVSMFEKHRQTLNNTPRILHWWSQFLQDYGCQRAPRAEIFVDTKNIRIVWQVHCPCHIHVTNRNIWRFRRFWFISNFRKYRCADRNDIIVLTPSHMPLIGLCTQRNLHENWIQLFLTFHDFGGFAISARWWWRSSIPGRINLVNKISNLINFRVF